jgi:hypothetical protein
MWAICGCSRRWPTCFADGDEGRLGPKAQSAPKGAKSSASVRGLSGRYGRHVYSLQLCDLSICATLTGRLDSLLLPAFQLAPVTLLVGCVTATLGPGSVCYDSGKQSLKGGNMKARLFAIVTAVSAFMVLGIGAAFATTPPDVSDTLGTTAASLMDELLDTAVAVLPYAATLAALFIGWRIVRRFIK